MYAPCAIRNDTLWAWLTLPTKVILLLVQKVRRPYFELALIAERLVQSSRDCPRCQQRDGRERGPREC